MFNGDIPEGQGSVNELLAECYELCYELRVAVETSPPKDEDSDEDEEYEAVEGHETSESEVEELAASLADTKLERRPETQGETTV